RHHRLAHAHHRQAIPRVGSRSWCAISVNDETPMHAAQRLASQALSKGFQLEGLHEYVNADGQAIYYRIRAKHPQTGDKWMRPMYANGGGFTLAEPKFVEGGKPLYALDRIAVADVMTPIYVVEGEKAADALLKVG